MVQKIESDGTAERIAGLKGPDRSQEPTASAPEFPGSTSDRERNRFRPSFWKRLTQQAVCNDDGSRIIGELEAKMDDVLVEMKGIRKEHTPATSVAINGIAKVGGKTVRIGPLGIPDVGPAVLYTANDAFGSLHAVDVPISGIIQSLRFFDKDDEGVNMTLLLFREKPSADETNNDPISLTDDDMSRLEAAILIDTWHDLLDNQIGTEDNLGIAYTAPDGRLWAQWVTRGGPTIAAGALPLWSMTILADE